VANSRATDSQAGNGSGPVASEPEVIPGRTQFGRRYSKAYKLRILALADKCTEPGEIGKLLRKEGLMHCTLTSFRRQRAAGYLDPVAPRSDQTDKTRRVLELERENRRLKRQLAQAEALIDVQKKVSRLLEAFDGRDPKESGS
jgi:transposase-like protein